MPEPPPDQVQAPVRDPLRIDFDSLRWGTPFSESVWINGGYQTRQKNGYGLFADYVLKNQSDRDLMIVREGNELRCFRVQLNQDGAWTDVQFAWCGTGSLPSVVPSGSQVFVSLPLPADRVPVRYGVVLYDAQDDGKEIVVWTDELTTTGS